MVTILQRPRWSIWKYKEVYQCDVPAAIKAPLEKAAEFYKKRDGTVVVESDRIRVSRNHWFSSLFAFSDLATKHEVTVELVSVGGRRALRCEYLAFYLYPARHVPPWSFETEVDELHSFLGNTPAPKPKKQFLLSPFHPLYRILYWLYRFISGTRYRTGRRVTRAGWMVIIGIFASLLMGSDTENTVVYQALPILVLLFLIAIVFSWFFRARFSALRLLPRFGTVGQPFHYRVMVKNLTSKPQSDLVLLENLSDPRPTFREWKVVQIADERKIRPFSFSARRSKPFRVAAVKEAPVPPIPPNGEVEVRVELEPMRRGMLRFGGIVMARPDPFGLFRGFVKVPQPQSTIILPKRYPLPPIALPGAMKYQEGGVAMASSIGRSEEFMSLREYRRGDPYRHIHWRSWAKTGKPIVKEFEDEFFVRHALVLDTFTDDPRSEAFEEAVSVAASFACTLITQESLLDLLFVGPQAYCFTAGRGLAHGDQMLEILASVRACPDEPFGKLEHLVMERAGSVSGCICVLLEWDEARRKLIEKLRALGVPTTVLLVVESGSKLKNDPALAQFGNITVLEAGKVEEGLARLS